MLLNLDLIICPQEGTALYETMVSAGIKDCATSLDDALVKKPVVEDFGICQ